MVESLVVELVALPIPLVVAWVVEPELVEVLP